MRNPSENEKNAAALHQESIVIDMMNASMVPEEGAEEPYVQKLVDSGLTAVNMSVAINDHFRQAIHKISRWYQFIDQFSSVLMLAKDVKDIRRAKETGKIGILLAFQNTAPIEDDLRLLQIFQQLGVSMMQITYNERNLAGDGCGERTNCGLSDFGIDMIREMNRLGIAIDLSHVGSATVQDVLEHTTAPVLYSHTGAFAIHPRQRNRTDEELRQIVQTGGMVGILSLTTFLSSKPDPEITIEDFFAHLDHVIDVIGIENVGFGLDLTENSKPTHYPVHKAIISSGWPWHYAQGLQSVSDIPNITKGLVSRGYTEREIQKILGGNFLRVMGKILGDGASDEGTFPPAPGRTIHQKEGGFK